MPITYTAVSQIADADPPLPDGTPSLYLASVATANATQYLRSLGEGSLTWAGTMRVSGTAANPIVVLGEIGSVSLYYSPEGGMRALSAPETTLGNTQIEGGGPLAANVWYYVYVYTDIASPAPAILFQISLTPPHTAGDVGNKGLFKNAAVAPANYRYLGCFPTDGTGNPIPLKAASGVYTYDLLGGPGATRPAALSPGLSIIWIPFATALWVPPHAQRVSMTLTLTPVGGAVGNATGSIRMLAGAGGGYTVTCGAVVGDARRGYVEFPVPDNGAGVYGAMEYIIAATAGTPPELFGDITGYVE